MDKCRLIYTERGPLAEGSGCIIQLARMIHPRVAWDRVLP